MICSISGNVPEAPVISRTTGHVYERRLIEKHIKATGKCPHTEGPLSLEDLVGVTTTNAVVRPRPPAATSVSALLKLFQNEWDAVMLETFRLKKHCHQVRQELAHALYQHDAACRVIARLTKERDHALKELADTRKNMQAAIAQAAAQMGGDAMEGVQATGITPAIVERIQTLAAELSQTRRKAFKKGPPATFPSAESIKTLRSTSSTALHSPSESGILCLDVHPQQQNIAITGGVDATLCLFDRESNKLEQTMRGGHKKRVLAVKFHPNCPLAVSGAADRTVAIWGPEQESGKWTHQAKLTCHSAPVTGVSVHPLGDYFVSASEDSTWAFHSIEGRTLQVVTCDESKGIGCVQIHPDGQIMGTGGHDHCIRIWDIRDQTRVSFEGHEAPVTAIDFSENGYYLATADTTGIVRLWDLRKSQSFMKDLDLGKGKQVRGVQFDNRGKYLAVGTPDGVAVFLSKKWDELVTLVDNSKPVTGVCWGTDASFLATCSKDRMLKFYGVEASA